jgi:hypothetical protein
MVRQVGILALAGILGVAVVGAAGEVEVGFGKADLTPDLNRHTAWLAGYGNNRKAAGVHDSLWARAVVIRDGDQRIALVSVDLVGVQRHTVLEVRRRLANFAHVLISSTHNHEGPDVIGLWGPSPRESGVDPTYLTFVVEKVVEAVNQADTAATPARAAYGTADGGDLLKDTRLPIVKDPLLRVVRFTKVSDGKPLGLLVQWGNHPESLGSRNTLITADFPNYTVKDLEAKHGVPVAYFTGAVGGLMTNPSEFPRPDGTIARDGTFEFAEAYGEATARVVDQALERLEPVALAPLVVSTGPVRVPLANPGYRQGRAIGVLPREAFAWLGDPEKLGERLPDRQIEGDIALETEVTYLRLGELHVAGIPGELYPELVYGEYQNPVEPNVDYPDAPLEPSVMDSLPGKAKLLFGLANDEVGYIIPKRQWDDVAPFAYGRQTKQYGEVNSVGPDVAPILMNALRERVRRVAGTAP